MPDNTTNKIAAQVQRWVRAIRAAGLTIEDIAREAGVSPSTVKKYGQGASVRTMTGRVFAAVRDLHDRVVVRRESIAARASLDDIRMPVAGRDAYVLARQAGYTEYDKIPERVRARIEAECASCTADLRARLARLHADVMSIAEGAEGGK
jgi:AcrR family transcriptional regulator